MSSESEFPGFGRILERSEAQELEVTECDVEIATKLLSPTCRSHSSMSTGRNLTGRCISDDGTQTPGRVSAGEAQMICKSVLLELLADTPGESSVQQVKPLAIPDCSAVSTIPKTNVPDCSAVSAIPKTNVPKIPFKSPVRALPSWTPEPVFGVDLARVRVLACDVGCVMGMLVWCGPCNTGLDSDDSGEKVVFSLCQMKPGYAVVGECAEGPKLLSSLCWKVQSTNGNSDVNIASIRRGDILMLEGPRWATKRLMEGAPPSTASTGARRLEGPDDVDPTDVMNDLAALADASSRLLAASELYDEPPLLRATAMPRLAFPSLSQRTPIESGRSFLKDSMRTPTDNGRVPVYSMRTPIETERSLLKDTRRSWEIGSDNDSAIRPFVPTLDFSAISGLREQRLQDSWIPVTPKEELPAMTPSVTQPSHRTNNVCIDPTGCMVMGLGECKLVTPSEALPDWHKTSGSMPKAMPRGYR
mmetsp:Transcript_3959/g.6412  ORF Transcript_3959/g.6412 Transcript_3959/m.6412 type:complete len:474 (+) Transcript_3959:126-1547(+)